jgi:hypothetical protein
MIGRDLFNSPCRICRRPTTHRTRTRHPERKSKSEGHCGSYQANRGRLWSQIPTSTQALLPTSTHSNAFCIIRVCISSSSSSRQPCWFFHMLLPSFVLSAHFMLLGSFFTWVYFLLELFFFFFSLQDSSPGLRSAAFCEQNAKHLNYEVKCLAVRWPIKHTF